MESWRVLRHYRVASRRLRSLERAGQVSEALVGLEATTLTAVALADRVETERAVLRLALRSAHARLRRLLALLLGTRALRGEPRALSRRENERTAAHLRVALLQRGHVELASTVAQLLGELEHLAARIQATSERLERVLALAAAAARQLGLALEEAPRNTLAGSGSGG